MEEGPKSKRKENPFSVHFDFDEEYPQLEDIERCTDWLSAIPGTLVPLPHISEIPASEAYKELARAQVHVRRADPPPIFIIKANRTCLLAMTANYFAKLSMNKVQKLEYELDKERASGLTSSFEVAASREMAKSLKARVVSMEAENILQGLELANITVSAGNLERQAREKAEVVARLELLNEEKLRAKATEALLRVSRTK